MKWDVIEVIAVAPLSLKVTFSDGTGGLVRFEPTHLTGVFSALGDPLIFQQVYIDHGAVTWPGDIDLAPDAMYQSIKQTGQWILR
jgi:hypothetical protein